MPPDFHPTVVWLVAEPPSVKTVELSSGTLELRCGESSYFGLPVSLCYNLFLLVLCLSVLDNFNEAKFINVTVYSLCIIWLGFLPAYFVSIQFGTVYESFFLLLAIILSASATLLCLLVPKIFIVILDKGEKRKEQTTGTGTETVLSTIQAYKCDSTCTQVLPPPSFLALSLPSYTLSPDSTNIKIQTRFTCCCFL